MRVLLYCIVAILFFIIVIMLEMVCLVMNDMINGHDTIVTTNSQIDIYTCHFDSIYKGKKIYQ